MERIHRIFCLAASFILLGRSWSLNDRFLGVRTTCVSCAHGCRRRLRTAWWWCWFERSRCHT
ncbi:hypothetical protein KC19_2G106500 [Ceratodon purpureus]|uniref:Secreted protein n=1 Tax=Ceratodon purpureus TaxID=3225 RepID=A0A8T0IU21_CERPU|nr:hypothetical protein KC19_2G106500 [Ceratodon purpureus]